jgi:transposase
MKNGKKKVTALIYRLKKRKDNYLAFLNNPDIPFTNNQAERDIRMIKVKQKISGGFRKKESAENFLVIRSFISTMNKLNHNIMEAFKKIITNSHDFSLNPRFTVNTT